MSELVSTAEIQKALEEYGLDISVGDVFLVKDRDARYLAITGLYLNKEGEPRVSFDIGYRGDSHVSLPDFKKRYRGRIKVVGDREKFEAEMIEKAKDVAALDPYSHMKESSETALMARSSQGQVQAMQDEMKNRRLQVETVKRVMELKVREIDSIVGRMSGMITFLSKVVGLFELYLGVHEKIVQIAEGVSAGHSPIHFRQLVLYMDEEVGDPRIKLDWDGVEHFDEWVRQPGNLQQVLPEEKGVVAIKPSRQDWYYSDNPWAQSENEAANRMTYLLCRNGDNLYRIWTSIPFRGKLFPSPEELTHTRKQALRSFTDREVKEITEAYQKQVLILQGVIDRTPIFQPIKHIVKLVDPDTYGEVVKLIWDAGASLPDGHIYYKDWKEQINSKIRRGTRILLAWNQKMRYANDSNSRFLVYYSKRGWGNKPPWPRAGIYKVEEVRPAAKKKEGKKRSIWTSSDAFIIRYNPHDTLYSSSWVYVEPYERKNRVGFCVKAEDQFVLNYDLVTVEDIEYFIHSRVNRQHYVDMIRILWDIRDGLLEEKRNEEALVSLIARELKASEEIVWEVVAWWKTKNIWQRPIMEDDAKALRMVKGRVKRILAGKV